MWTPEIFVDRMSTDVEGPFLKVEGAVFELWPVGRAVSNEGDGIERTGGLMTEWEYWGTRQERDTKLSLYLA
jgi:hypothetical protein